MRSFIVISSLTILLGAEINDAVACSCQPAGPPCQNYFMSDVVFIGTVRSITPVPGGDYQASVRVDFHDVASSRGLERTSVVVFTAEHTASCGYPFKQGERYVVYANRSKQTGQMLASLCSRTRPVSQAGEDITFFGTFSRPAANPLVFGKISYWDRDPATADGRIAGPVAGVVLTLNGPDRSFQTRTDREGRYEFAGIPPGSYRLTGLPPPLFSGAPIKTAFELRDARACHQADFQISYDSRISGSIVDAEGRPVADALIELTTADNVARGRYAPSKLTSSDKAGNFELTEVLPDRYLLSVNLPVGPDIDVVSPTRFHPGTSDSADAYVFDVRPGQRVTLEPTLIRPAPRAYRLFGQLRFEDGKPAAGLAVRLEDGYHKTVAPEVQTDADGRFSFFVHDGLVYMATALYVDPLMPGRTQASASKRFTASEETLKTVELVLLPVKRGR